MQTARHNADEAPAADGAESRQSGETHATGVSRLAVPLRADEACFALAVRAATCRGEPRCTTRSALYFQLAQRNPDRTNRHNGVKKLRGGSQVTPQPSRAPGMPTMSSPHLQTLNGWRRPTLASRLAG